MSKRCLHFSFDHAAPHPVCGFLFDGHDYNHGWIFSSDLETWIIHGSSNPERYVACKDCLKDPRYNLYLLNKIKL